MENIINNEELFGKSALDELTNENLPALIEDDPEKRLRSFLSSPFISASLPLKDVNKNIFKRKYNNISLSLASTADKVPFGKYGRLLLTILTTHAVLMTEALWFNTIQFVIFSKKCSFQQAEVTK